MRHGKVEDKNLTLIIRLLTQCLNQDTTTAFGGTTEEIMQTFFGNRLVLVPFELQFHFDNYL
jgi:hypothetical protein